MAASARRVAKDMPAWRKIVQKWLYDKSYFNQLGLMRDDIRLEDEDTKEAIRRLPEKLYDERMFRISRALYLSCRKEVLPKEEWTQIENDVLYLKPYIEEVIRERKEKAAWNKR